jgi:hypothetical protein
LFSFFDFTCEESDRKNNNLNLIIFPLVGIIANCISATISLQKLVAIQSVTAEQINQAPAFVGLVILTVRKIFYNTNASLKG